MAADLSQVRQQYVYGLQAVAAELLKVAVDLANLNTLYLGGGLSGTFVDAELAANTNTKHMLGADIGTFTANLNTVSTAISAAIQQNMAKCVGVKPPV